MDKTLTSVDFSSFTLRFYSNSLSEKTTSLCITGVCCLSCCCAGSFCLLGLYCEMSKLSVLSIQCNYLLYSAKMIQFYLIINHHGAVESQEAAVPQLHIRKKINGRLHFGVTKTKSTLICFCFEMHLFCYVCASCPHYIDISEPLEGLWERCQPCSSLKLWPLKMMMQTLMFSFQLGLIIHDKGWGKNRYCIVLWYFTWQYCIAIQTPGITFLLVFLNYWYCKCNFNFW